MTKKQPNGATPLGRCVRLAATTVCSVCNTPLKVGHWISSLKRIFCAGCCPVCNPPCPKHKTYKGLRRPRVDCNACWNYWCGKHPQEVATS
jgi:hypothetical protein